jgi:tRNA-binding EMAP/Myf-like protein
MENTITLKPEITIDTFYSIDIRFCKILGAEDILKNPKKIFDEVDNPVKAYMLTIDTGFDIRDIVTNIVHFKKEDLIGITTTFILNLPEAVIRGVKSKGMIFMLNSDTLSTGGNMGDIVV